MVHIGKPAYKICLMKKPTTLSTDHLTLGDEQKGLAKEEALRREKDGYDNSFNAKTGKTYGEIFKSNIFQFFNFVLYGIAILFMVFSIVLKATGNEDIVPTYFGFSKYLFLGPVTINIIISIIQECRSKRVLDKLRLVTESKSIVIRDGVKEKIPSSRIVYGDLIYLETGDQCPVDMKVVSGKAELDESMLTGESDPVEKVNENGKNVAYAGSFLVSGAIYGIATAVGASTYSNQLSTKLKGITKTKSELMKSIYRIINFMATVLLVMLLLVLGTMIYKVIRWGGNLSVFETEMNLAYPETWAKITVTAAAFAIGVLPTGLVLVTSITLAASVVILAGQNTLIQELYSLENLSRVDTICLDKTGTLTDGTMNVDKVIYYGEEASTHNLISTLVASMKSYNQTGKAILNYFGGESSFNIKEDIPFSSARKYSGAVLVDGRKLLLGAPEYLCDDKIILDTAKHFASEGKRVLLFKVDETPSALIVLKDGIRKSAPETIAFFNENGVDVKIISGDNIETVSKIASLCGVPNADKAISLENVSIEELDEICAEYTIFGRVSPEQKESLVEALQRKGRKVAMTGDGVNDILALRKANSSITFEKATDAAKSCADVVLLDNDFSHLKEVVGQGRKVVNNTQRSSILFLMKTVCIVLLALFLIPFKRGHMVFSIENIYLMQTAIIAVGGFLLSLEPSRKPIVGTYRENVYPKALASGVVLLLGALTPVILNAMGLLSADNTTALISILTTIAGIAVLIRLAWPFTLYRWIVFGAVIVVVLFLSLALPKTYLGGMPTSSLDIVSGAFANEFFQPWNSAVYTNIFSQPGAWVTILTYSIIAYPEVLLIEILFKNIGAFIGDKLHD